MDAFTCLCPWKTRAWPCLSSSTAPHFILRAGVSHRTWSFLFGLHWLPSKPRRPTLSRSPSLHSSYSWFFTQCWRLSSVPHSSTGSALPTEKAPQTFIFISLKFSFSSLAWNSILRCRLRHQLVYIRLYSLWRMCFNHSYHSFFKYSSHPSRSK